jgi:hypothetical protein
MADVIGDMQSVGLFGWWITYTAVDHVVIVVIADVVIVEVL